MQACMYVHVSVCMWMCVYSYRHAPFCLCLLEVFVHHLVAAAGAPGTGGETSLLLQNEMLQFLQLTASLSE